MTRIDSLDKLSYAELLDLQERVKVALVDRKAAQAREVKEKLQALASKSGFSLYELFGGKRGGRKGTVAVKYRNPKIRRRRGQGGDDGQRGSSMP